MSRCFSLTANSLLRHVLERNRFIGRFLPAMHPFHVIPKIVESWKATSFLVAVTSSIETEMRACSMTMQAVCLSFVPQKARCGGESLINAGLELALEGLQMRVDEFTAKRKGQCRADGKGKASNHVLLIVAFQFVWLVVASLGISEWTMIVAIGGRAGFVSRISTIAVVLNLQRLCEWMRCHAGSTTMLGCGSDSHGPTVRLSRY